MKKKFFVVIAIIAVLVILLTPVRMNLKDGGSVRYKALVYEVTKIHQLAPEVDGVKPYIDGFEIKILGMTVYRETNEQTNSSLMKYKAIFERNADRLVNANTIYEGQVIVLPAK